MATSGWQNEQFIKQCMTNYYYNGNINVSSITHSGTNLRVVGRVALCSRGTSGYRYNWGNIIYANVAGKGATQVRPSGYYYVGTDTYCDFDVTISGVSATTTSYSLPVAFTSYNLNVTLYWTLSFDASATAPSGLTATLGTIYDDGADISVDLSSYGIPSSEANRYIEASIMGQSTYGGLYRFNYGMATNSKDFTINNSDRTNASRPLTIIGNTRYWYGAYATNTSLTTSIVAGTFVTCPARITSIDAIDTGGDDVLFRVNHGDEGTELTIYTEYSFDGTNWVVASDEFALTLSGTTTLTFRRRNSSGYYTTKRVTIAPFNAKLYGSVGGVSKKIDTLYGSVGGKSKKIKKLYGSVNGRSKLIYEDV